MFVVGPGSGGRADKVLSRALRDHSRVAWQRAFGAGLVLRGGKALDQKDWVKAGEEIAYSFPAVKAAELAPNAIPLEVLLEDKHLLVLNKPAGMVVHPGAGTGDDTLVHALLAHCAGKLSGIGGVERPGIVHRLDRETSGAIVVAKSDAAHRGLAEQFARRTVTKEYLALVEGVPELLSGSILKPIGRHPRHRHKMIAAEERVKSFGEDAAAEEDDVPSGGRRDAHTDWAVVERYAKAAALLRCTLHTGRTHQIRVHLKSIGHVLLGDAVYGFKPTAALPPIPRVMLHSEHLGFVHPITKKPVDIRAPLPKDFATALAALKKRTPPKPLPKRSPSTPSESRSRPGFTSRTR